MGKIINKVISKGISMHCYNENGILTGSIASIDHDITVTIENVAGMYNIVGYLSECGAHTQINCHSWKFMKFETNEEVK